MHFSDTVPDFVFETGHSLEVADGVVHFFFEADIVLQLFLLILSGVISVWTESSCAQSLLIHGFHAAMTSVGGDSLARTDRRFNSSEGLISFETVNYLG